MQPRTDRHGAVVRARQLGDVRFRVRGSGSWPDFANFHGPRILPYPRRCFYRDPLALVRSEEHTSALQSLMRISYAVFCLKKTNKTSSETLRPQPPTAPIVYIQT